MLKKIFSRSHHEKIQAPQAAPPAPLLAGLFGYLILAVFFEDAGKSPSYIVLKISVMNFLKPTTWRVQC
jgi:hypothetical protein